MNIKGKKISIIGAVRSGIGAAKLAKKLGAIPFVSDTAPEEKIINNLQVLGSLGIDYEAGKHTDRVLESDFIITSPGVPSNSEVLIKCFEKGIPVISELEFASQFCKGKIIAITGTNGKTTTTTLTAHTLNAAGIKCHLAGNIGNAFSEVVLDVKEEDFVALEVSSFQLDYINSFQPEYSLILNITPDHLDRYNNDIEKYINAKLNIYKNQQANQYLIYWDDDQYLPSRISNPEASVMTFSTKYKIEKGAYYEKGNLKYKEKGTEEIICTDEDLSIKGMHNIANALAVICVVKKIGLNNDVIKSSFQNFKGVEHRLEFVRELNGVKFINDSKATNIDSVWYALQSFKEPIRLILGGKDKGNDYTKILHLVKKYVEQIYAIGSSSQKIYDFFSKAVKVEKYDSLESAVNTAQKDSSEGEIVLLSPACASFDMFDNYEHRGKVFKEIVSRLN